MSLLFSPHLFHFEQQIVNLEVFPVHADKEQQLATIQPSPNTDLYTGKLLSSDRSESISFLIGIQSTC